LVSLAILSLVVVFPAYSRLAETQYTLDSLRTEAAQTQDLLNINERLIRDLPCDEVLVRRLARVQTEWVPPNELVVTDRGMSKRTGGILVTLPPRPRARPPARWVLLLGAVLRKDFVRNTLVLLAAGGIVIGLLVSASPKVSPFAR